MPDWAQTLLLAAIAGGLIKTLGDAVIGWLGRRKVQAEANQANAEANKANAEAARNIAEASQINGDQLLHIIDAQGKRIDELTEMRSVDNVRAGALAEEVDQLKKQQGVNIATIAALNSQNATTLKMNNELLLENRLLHQRVGQLENELSTERQANAILNQNVKGLEARISELEARNPA